VPTHGLAPGELALRHSLGIPDDAAQVIVFAQTSHLDIDWQQTFDDYYSSFVEGALIQARQVMQAQPRAFYSIAEMAYLQQHVTAHPEELAPLQALARKGAFRIVGGGMTSPDTLLPETEILFRDLLYGVRFSEDVFGVTPRAAWLPDSFGHSGTAPDILAAAGFLSVGMSRIDGAATIYQQIFHPDLQPLPGSTAAILQEIGSADFIWQGTSGASVLAHFIAGKGLYCEGENIDWPSDLTTPGTHIGTFQGNDPTFTDGRIDGYVQENTPYAKTPYLFVPVGCDFEAPKPQLIQYLDGYNQRRYPATGAWAVAAPFDDFGALVSYWRDVLPQLSGDLAPAYMGFFGSRPAVKRGVRDAARPFFVAESFASALGAQGAALVASAAPELELLTRTDHHDFVTGTSADDVVQDEQMPLLAAAQLAGESLEGEVALEVASRIPVSSGAVTRALVFNASSATRSDVTEVLLPVTGAPAALHAVVSGMVVPLEIVGTPSSTYETARLSLSGVPPWSWTMVDLMPGAPASPSSQVALALLDAQGVAATGAAVKRVVLSNSHVRAQFDLSADGFALTALSLDGADVVEGPSMLPNDYRDQGGLWRLGNEMAGCTLDATPRVPGPASFTVLESTPLQVRVSFAASTYTLEASLAAGVDGLDVAVTTGAAEGTTRTFSLSLADSGDDALKTSSPAGWQVRPAQHVFDPTFFPAVSWAQVGGVAVLLRQSTGVRMSTPGALELMVARDARAEQCDVMGGTGSDASTHRIEWRLSPASTPASAETAAQVFARPLDALLVGTAQAAGPSLPPVSSLASVSGQAVISAIKPADRGGGVIVRALLLPGPGQLQLGPSLVGSKLEQVDLTERNVQSLGTAGATIPLDAAGTGSIVGLRLY
jgi:hypothetical protein